METMQFISPTQPQPCPVLRTIFRDIFDAGITAKEMEEIFSYPMTEEEYFMLNSSEDSYNADLWKLFYLRNQMPEAEKYKSKIQNEEVRSWLGYSDLIAD